MLARSWIWEASPVFESPRPLLEPLKRFRTDDIGLDWVSRIEIKLYRAFLGQLKFCCHILLGCESDGWHYSSPSWGWFGLFVGRVARKSTRLNSSHLGI